MEGADGLSRAIGRLRCPARVRRQLGRIVAGLRETIGDHLIGVYLHGSLAMGCFNPRSSDLDLLVVTRTRMPADVWKRLAELLVRSSSRPAPIELSVVRRSQLRPFRHPTPFDLCFSREFQSWYRMILKSGRWRTEYRKVKRDADLAGHCTVLRQRGIRLWGAPVQRAIPAVPRRFHLASVLADHAWGWRHVIEDPKGMGAYWILNACRTAAFLESGRVLSKAEGGRWGLRRLPRAVRPTIHGALRAYRGQRPRRRFFDRDLVRFGRAVETYSRGRCAFPGS